MELSPLEISASAVVSGAACECKVVSVAGIGLAAGKARTYGVDSALRILSKAITVTSTSVPMMIVSFRIRTNSNVKDPVQTPQAIKHHSQKCTRRRRIAPESGYSRRRRLPGFGVFPIFF
jgi:hypothetical protein